jgi:hypothetical protein
VKKVLLISLALVLAISVGLIGCTAEYVPEITQYGLTITSTEGGLVTTPGQGTGSFAYDEGEAVNLVAEPDEGYRFESWTGDVSTIADINAASTTITVNGNYSIIANFIAQYVLTIDSTEGGSVTSPGEGVFTYDEGTDVYLVAVADKCYVFEEWDGDVSSIADDKNPTITITMNANYVITADFGDPTTQRATILVDGNPDDWSSLEPALVDPQGDCTCSADTDVKHIYTAMDDRYAYVMVETYGVPINGSAVIEINFDYKAGQHFSYDVVYGFEFCDDLHTNIWEDCDLRAWNDDDLDGAMETYPIIGYVCTRGDVMELSIPLSQIENATRFNPTVVVTWKDGHKCDLSFTYFGS